MARVLAWGVSTTYRARVRLRVCIICHCARVQKKHVRGRALFLFRPLPRVLFVVSTQ